MPTDPDSYELFATTAVPGLTEVRLYAETLDHIRDEHAEVPIELPSMVDAIGTAITAPTHVEPSYGGSYVFVDATTTNSEGDPLRVPVKPIKGTTSGRVRTAYFATTQAPPETVARRAG